MKKLHQFKQAKQVIKTHWSKLLILATIGLALLLALIPKTSTATTSKFPITPIKHIVIIQKENRSFDTYFGKFPGADGATSGKMSNGQTVQLGPTPDPMPNDIGHGYLEDFVPAYHNGQMDGFDLEKGAFAQDGTNLAYTQFDRPGIPNYWSYADTYALADRMFSAWKGSSFGNNIIGVAAQTGQFESSMNFNWIYDNPFNNNLPPPPPPLPAWGCDAPNGTQVQLGDSNGPTTQPFPCFNFRALPNELAAAGVSWKFYTKAGQAGFIHNGLDALTPVRNDPSLWSKVVSKGSIYYDAVKGLPSVTWVVGKFLDHPVGSVCYGENDLVNLVNAIMNGKYWPSTAIFVYWDEWGGFYDHVPPPQIDGVSHGFRVPLLIISPYTKVGTSANGGSITHTEYSQLSLLKTIEDNWGLPPLTAKDAAANNVFDAFDFKAPPRPKLLLTQRTCPPLNLTPQQQKIATESD